MKHGKLIWTAAAALCLAATTKADDLTIVSWGGAYSKAQSRAYNQPYAAETGVNIINDDSAAEAVAKIRAMNEANNVTWDVVDVVIADAIRLCDEGLSLEIDPDRDLAPAHDGGSASADFGEWWASDCMVPNVVYSTAFGYRTDKVGATPPDDICDVFDLKKYPGKRALEKRPINNVEWALLCDGVAKEDLYDVLETEAGQDRALAKLDTIKDHVIWWSAGADTPQLLADGEVVIGSGYNGRLFAVIEEQKQPIAIMWDAQILDYGGWLIPTGIGRERTKRALEFVKYATTPRRHAEISKYISYSPARASAGQFVDKHADLGIDMEPHMPTSKVNSANTIIYNHQFWADYRDDMDAKFQAWLAR